MADRITDKHLQSICDTLNRITSSPMTPYIDGKAQIGCFCMSGAYGGVCIHRICTDGGGVTTPIVESHIPKRELYDRAWAFIRGFEMAKRMAAELIEA